MFDIVLGALTGLDCLLEIRGKGGKDFGKP